MVQEMAYHKYEQQILQYHRFLHWQRNAFKGIGMSLYFTSRWLESGCYTRVQGRSDEGRFCDE
jgi:hypothetical protein